MRFAKTFLALILLSVPAVAQNNLTSPRISGSSTISGTVNGDYARSGTTTGGVYNADSLSVSGTALANSAFVASSTNGGASVIPRLDASADLTLSGTSTSGSFGAAGNLYLQDLKTIGFRRLAANSYDIGTSLYYNTAHDIYGGEFIVSSVNSISLNAGNNNQQKGTIQIGTSGKSSEVINFQYDGLATALDQNRPSKKVTWTARYWDGASAGIKVFSARLNTTGTAGLNSLDFAYDDPGFGSVANNTTQGTVAFSMSQTANISYRPFLVQNGSLGSFILGADTSASTISSTTQKVSSFQGRNYASGTGWTIIHGRADSGANNLFLGGGTSVAPPATQVSIYTGSSATTNGTGTETLRSTSTGLTAFVGITGTNLTLTGTLALSATTAAPSNTATPVAWTDVVISGTTFKVPLYQ
jgi:hypothetical protein